MSILTRRGKMSEYLFFAGLQVAVTMVFAWLAARYRYVAQRSAAVTSADAFDTKSDDESAALIPDARQ
jgi:hypothetical protein